LKRTDAPEAFPTRGSVLTSSSVRQVDDRIQVDDQPPCWMRLQVAAETNASTAFSYVAARQLAPNADRRMRSGSFPPMAVVSAHYPLQPMNVRYRGVAISSRTSWMGAEPTSVAHA
jgi:hypothetical protein